MPRERRRPTLRCRAILGDASSLCALTMVCMRVRRQTPASPSYAGWLGRLSNSTVFTDDSLVDDTD